MGVESSAAPGTDEDEGVIPCRHPSVEPEMVRRERAGQLSGNKPFNPNRYLALLAMSMCTPLSGCLIPNLHIRGDLDIRDEADEVEVLQEKDLAPEGPDSISDEDIDRIAADLSATSEFIVLD